MEEKDIREIKKNTDVLLGSVETHKCDPLQDCEECNGSGKCRECEGHGEVECHDCHGSGDCHHCHGHGKDTCRECHGQGSKRCNECGGTGSCRKCGGSGQIRCKNCGGKGIVEKMYSWEHQSHLDKCTECRGTGYVKCPDCSGLFSGGSGKCKKCKGSGQLECGKCHGSGEITCNHCNGSGKCTTCRGSGKLTCKHCDGSGKCPNCSGSGKVTCKRCKGSGWYQTFIKSETTLYAKDWVHISNNSIKEAVEKSRGATIYDDYYKKWKSASQLDFDKTDEAFKTCRDYLGESSDKVDEYISAYETNKDIKSPAWPNDKPVAKHLTVEAIPVTKIEYTTNGQDYTIYISGDNHVVSYESVPTQIQAYKQSFLERVRLAMTEKKRMKQYAMLAAYIFQSDGKTKEESKMLSLIMNELNLSDSSKAKFLAELDGFNSSMPYEEFRKHIKGLFTTKKALSFAWQCMAVDKQISGEEETLYQRLCSEYQLADGEVETLKRYAHRFAKIKDENIVSEYCDKTAKSKSLRVATYSVIAGLIIAVVAIAGVTVNSLIHPDQKVETKVETVTPTSELKSEIDKEVELIEKDIEKNEESSAGTGDISIGAPTLISMGISIYNDRSQTQGYLSTVDFKKAGSDSFDEYWVKDVKYNVDDSEVKGATTSESCIFKISKDSKDVTIIVFAEGVYNELKKTLELVGYKKTDDYYSSGHNHFEVFTNSGVYPKITASDESSMSDLPYNIRIGDDD